VNFGSAVLKKEDCSRCDKTDTRVCSGISELVCHLMFDHFFNQEAIPKQHLHYFRIDFLSKFLFEENGLLYMRICTPDKRYENQNPQAIRLAETRILIKKVEMRVLKKVEDFFSRTK